MEIDPQEKAVLVIAIGMMGFAVIGFVVMSFVGSAYLLWPEQQEILQEPPPAPPFPAPRPPEAEATSVQTGMIGVWIRSDGASHSMALFNPLMSEGYGVFFSSEGGNGVWFTGQGTTVFLVHEGGELLQRSVTFPTATTMAIAGPEGTQTWRRVAAITRQRGQDSNLRYP